MFFSASQGLTFSRNAQAPCCPSTASAWWSARRTARRGGRRTASSASCPKQAEDGRWCRCPKKNADVLGLFENLGSKMFPNLPDKKKETSWEFCETQNCWYFLCFPHLERLLPFVQVLLLDRWLILIPSDSLVEVMETPAEGAGIPLLRIGEKTVHRKKGESVSRILLPHRRLTNRHSSMTSTWRRLARNRHSEIQADPHRSHMLTWQTTRGPSLGAQNSVLVNLLVQLVLLKTCSHGFRFQSFSSKLHLSLIFHSSFEFLRILQFIRCYLSNSRWLVWRNSLVCCNQQPHFAASVLQAANSSSTLGPVFSAASRTPQLGLQVMRLGLYCSQQKTRLVNNKQWYYYILIWLSIFKKLISQFWHEMLRRQLREDDFELLMQLESVLPDPPSSHPSDVYPSTQQMWSRPTSGMLPEMT